MQKTIQNEQDNFWLWIPVCFGFGAAFYFSFTQNFLGNFFLFSGLFLLAIFLGFLNRNSLRVWIFICCGAFLFGSFYSFFYEKTFLNHTEISGKVYVDVVGKVESLKMFYNPVNKLEGLNLVISQPEMYKSEFVAKKKKKSKPRKTKQILKQVQDDDVVSLETNSKNTLRHPELVSGSEKPMKTRKPRKPRKPRQISPKTIEKNYVNLFGYQEIDREFLDAKKNYQQVAWKKINGRETFPNPPQKISLNLVKNPHIISINDKISLHAMLQPAQEKEFSDDFDFKLNAKAKKIGAYGFAIGEAKILEKAKISNFDQWFLAIREKIRGKISAVLKGDEAAISLAFLIGDQNQISKDLAQKIRDSGLSHLLSISGFHLSLAGGIFFFATRFLFSRSEYLALNFDLKKLSSIFAIFATYFYLKIAASPLPAQRAFLMIILVFLALFLSEKINSRRAVMTSILLLIFYNPLSVFNIGFQLSFAAILVLGVFYEDFNHQIFPKFLHYFLEIILLSILIQIATLPFLMHSFQNVSALGFVANILAIPLASFFIMPVGFLALFLMPLNLEKYFLLLMQEGIFLIEKIAIFVADLNYSHFTSPRLPSFGLALAIFGLFLICLSKSKLRIFGIAIFILSFSTIFLVKKPDIIFEKNQKFFATYDENGLVFSKKLNPTKQREAWMKHFNESEFKFMNCEEKKCVIEKDKKILVLLKRNKISEICKKDFDLIVNLTAKYQLPRCAKAKIKIDNIDFYNSGTQELFFEN